LLDNASLVVQLGSLERKVTKFGRDSVDHALGAHDDIGNAVAGVLTLLGASAGGELGMVNLLKKIGTTAASWFSRKPGEIVAVGPAAVEYLIPPNCKNCGQSRFDPNCTGTPPKYRCIACSNWNDAILAAAKVISIRKMLCCPACGNESVIRGAGAPTGCWHCNNCSINFDADGNNLSVAADSEACEASPTKMHVWRKIPGGQKRCDYCSLQRWDGAPMNTMGQSRAQYAARNSGFRQFGRFGS
jgi:hypothetical protein